MGLTKNNEILQKNQDIEHKISIVRNMISFYELRIKNPIKNETTKRHETSLKREQKHLERYKDLYPEFFI